MTGPLRPRTLLAGVVVLTAVLAGCSSDGHGDSERANVLDTASGEITSTVAVTSLTPLGLSWDEDSRHYQAGDLIVRLGAAADLATFDSRAQDCQDWQQCLVDLGTGEQDGLTVTVEASTDQHGNEVVTGETTRTGGGQQYTVLKKLDDTFVICEARSAESTVLSEARALCDSVHDLAAIE